MTPHLLCRKEIVYREFSDAATAGLPAPMTKAVNRLCGYSDANTGSVSRLLGDLVDEGRIKMLGRLGVQRVVHIVETGKTTAGPIPAKKPVGIPNVTKRTQSSKFHSRERAPMKVTLYTLVHPKMLEAVR